MPDRIKLTYPHDREVEAVELLHMADDAFRNGLIITAPRDAEHAVQLLSAAGLIALAPAES